MPLLKGTTGLHTKLSKTRAKWCRQFSQPLRRDCIATLSEGLNGAIKRQTCLKTQVLLAKTFTQQSAYAYQECSLAARKLPDEGITPLAKRCICIGREVSTHLICHKKGEKHVVYMGEREVDQVHVVGGRYSCSCDQVKDIGTPCAHISALDRGSPEMYVDPIWSCATAHTPIMCLPIEKPRSSSDKVRLISRIRGFKELSDDATGDIPALLDKHKEIQ